MIFIYDLETTGLEKDDDDIIEICVVNHIDDTHYTTLVQSELDNSAVHINHITMDMYQEKGVPLETMVTSLINFIGHEECYLIAHNNDNFDQGFLTRAFQKVEMTVPLQWKFIDSLKISRTLHPTWKRHNLATVVKNIKSQRDNNSLDTLVLNSHRSYDDVKCLQYVFSYWLESHSIEELHEISVNSVMKKMPFGKHKGVHLSKIPVDYIQWMKSQGILERDHEISKGLAKFQPQIKNLLANNS